LKPASGTAWTQVFAAESFYEFLIAMHGPVSLPDSHFGRESLPAFARAFVEMVNLHNVRCLPYSLQFWLLLSKAGDVLITPPAWIVT
jgi:hypothetical protein